MSFAESIRNIVPRWLLGRTGERLLFAWGLMIDGMIDSADYGLRGRTPGAGNESALPLVGDDRNMLRYPAETDAGYAARLSKAFDTWKTAGLASAIIRQLEGFCGPDKLRIRIVARSGLWHSFASGQDLPGTVTKTAASPANWFWDSLSARWWRIWIIIYPNGKWTSTRKWGDGSKWGDGGSWGLNIDPHQADSIRELVKRWKPANVQAVWIIYALDNALFDPSVAYPDATLPDPTWENWSKLVSGKKVAARSANARYQSGVI